MTRVPPEIIKASIKLGSVYYFHEEHFSSPHKHYFVVINRNPHKDEIILLACASHQIDKTKLRRPNCSAETFVIITPEQYCGFSVDSIFDCNRIEIRTFGDIMKKYSNNELSIKPEMDIKLVEMIRHSVLASNQIEPRHKAMLQD